MGTESGSDGHPIDAYLTRASKRQRREQAAEEANEQADSQSGDADDRKHMEAADLEDNDEQADDVDAEEGGFAGSEASGEPDSLDETEQSDDITEDQDERGISGEDAAQDAAPTTGAAGDEEAQADAAGTTVGNGNNAGPGTETALTGAAMALAAAQLSARAAAAAPPPADAKPVGVVLVDDTTEIVRDFEVAKLLRNPRYFDDYAEFQSRRCFNCGQIGHQARDCENEARAKPCYRCAQFGHDGNDCPNELCFRCKRPGHKVRKCPLSRDTAAEGRPCNRCGRQDCDAAGKGDYFRYEGGCTRQYTAADLRNVRCMSCGDAGHLMCKPVPKAASVPSCFNCGRMGHYGESCPSGPRPHLLAERRGDEERAAAEVLENEMKLERELEDRRMREDQLRQQRYQQQQQRGGYGGAGYDRYNGGGGYGQDTRGGVFGGDNWYAGAIGYAVGVPYGVGGGYVYGAGGYGDGALGARSAQMEWGYNGSRQDDRRGMGDRPFSPDYDSRGGRGRYDDRRSQTPRW